MSKAFIFLCGCENTGKSYVLEKFVNERCEKIECIHDKETALYKNLRVFTEKDYGDFGIDDKVVNHASSFDEHILFHQNEPHYDGVKQLLNKIHFTPLTPKIIWINNNYDLLYHRMKYIRQDNLSEAQFKIRYDNHNRIKTMLLERDFEIIEIEKNETLEDAEKICDMIQNIIDKG